MDREKLLQVAEGRTPGELAEELLKSVVPDKVAAVAKLVSGDREPTGFLLQKTQRRMMEEAVKPFDSSPQLLDKLVDVRPSHEQLYDEFNKDRAHRCSFPTSASRRRSQPRLQPTPFRAYIEEHNDQIEALQNHFSRPYAQRLTLKEIKDLAP